MTSAGHTVEYRQVDVSKTQAVAEAVKEALAKVGVAAPRIQTTSFGETRAIAPEVDEKNRVSEIPVMDMTGFNALDTGGEGVVFGHLANNDPLDKGELVAYCVDRWEVTLMIERQREAGCVKK